MVGLYPCVEVNLVEGICFPQNPGKSIWDLERCLKDWKEDLMG